MAFAQGCSLFFDGAKNRAMWCSGDVVGAAVPTPCRVGLAVADVGRPVRDRLVVAVTCAAWETLLGFNRAR